MIIVFGLNHKTAPLEVREKFVFCEEDIKRSNYLLSEGLIEGLVIVSTCNRTEFYLHVNSQKPEKAFQFFLENLSKHRKLQQYNKSHFYKKIKEDAIRHLFYVATGLNSMAIGEYQIVQQLKTTLSLSTKHKLNSPLLIRSFNKAFEASKKARTQTGLNKGAISVSYAAVEAVNKILKNLKDKSILLIGAGETGELTIQSLIKRGCHKFTITNRTYENAEKVASKYKAEAVDISQLEHLLVENDIIVTSTASKKAIIDTKIAQTAISKRNGKTQIYIDLSVPRNVENRVDSIDNISIYDMDKLNSIIENNYEERKIKVIEAEHIIDEVVKEFTEWNHSRKLSDTFKNIHQHTKAVKQAQLIEYEKHNKDQDLKEVSKFGDLVSNKLARVMIENIKSITDNGKKETYVQMINELFDSTQNK